MIFVVIQLNSSFDQQLSLTEQRFSPVWSEFQFSLTQLLIEATTVVKRAKNLST
jgi:hypothetical protein